MEQDQDNTDSGRAFDHPKNFSIGAARLIWADATDAVHCTDKVARPEGWVLPGGERTTDTGRVMAVAAAMDTIFKQ